MQNTIKDFVTFPVTTQYGDVEVKFLIVDILSENDNIYLAYAQGRIARIQRKANNTWELQDDVDVLNSLKL